MLAALLAILGLLVVKTVSRAQSPTPVTVCGSYGGNLILQQNLSTSNGNCLTVTGDSTTIDGNGQTITVSGSGHAVFNFNKASLTVRNLTSNSDVYINGESADNALVENSDLGGVEIVAADDVTIQNNTLDSAVLGQEKSDAQRITFTGNTVDSTANKLVAIRGSGIVPCAASNHVFTDNTLIARHACSGSSCDEPMALFIWCSAGSTYRSNSIQTTDQAQGIQLRDESDNNAFESNVVTVSANVDGDFGVLNITSGNAGKHHPQNNVFTDNLFRSNGDLALNLQSPGSGNRFERNIFWSNTAALGGLSNDGSNNNQFNHNTFVNVGTGTALTFDYWNNRTADSFTNNIFYTAGATVVRTIQWSFTRYRGDYNLFWSTSSTALFAPQGTFNSWKSAAAPDDTNSRSADPLFVNLAGGNFSLQITSPAVGSASDGTNIGAKGAGTGTLCTENWTCADWSACINGRQTRTCTDQNGCGTTNDRPTLTQSCTVIIPDTAPPANVTNLEAR